MTSPRYLVLAAILPACVVEPPGQTSRSVIGGTETEATEYQATGGIVEFGRAVCTGTLISPKAVLTAAHCLEAFRFSGEAPGFTLELDATTVAAEQVVPGIAAYQHPEFDINAALAPGLGEFNDVGLVILARELDVPVEIAASAAAVALLEVGTTIELVGYGQSSEEISSAGIKRKGIGTVDSFNGTEMFLVGPQQNCFGDSGGPGFMDSGDGARLLVGVVSRGPDPASGGCDMGGIHTRVDAYLGWITDVLAGHDAGPVGVPDAGSPDGGAGADGDGDAGCCAVAGGRRPVPPGAVVLLVAVVLGLAAARRRRA
jgi:secreted trypsin-like serine protease